MISRLFTTLALAAVMLTSGGCLIMKGHSTEETGVKVSKATLNQVKPGETTEAWVVAALGEPTSRRKVDDQTEILRYDHKVTTEEGGAVLFLYAGGESIEKATSVLFEVSDGVVTRYWTEG